LKSFFELMVLEFQDTQARNEILTLSFKKMNDLLFSSAILNIILMNSSDAKVRPEMLLSRRGKISKMKGPPLQSNMAVTPPSQN